MTNKGREEKELHDDVEFVILCFGTPTVIFEYGTSCDECSSINGLWNKVIIRLLVDHRMSAVR